MAYFSDNKSKFVSLRRILPILSFILLITVQVSSQASDKHLGGHDPVSRIVNTYPNPATTYITFEIRDGYQRGLTLRVFSGLLGKKMSEVSNMPSKLTINLNDYTRGMYIYQLVDASGKIVESGKFQVSK